MKNKVKRISHFCSPLVPRSVVVRLLTIILMGQEKEITIFRASFPVGASDVLDININNNNNKIPTRFQQQRILFLIEKKSALVDYFPMMTF